jgi:hypothetical protein
MTRHVKVAMDGSDILAAVAGFAVDPTCRACGGPAQLGTDVHGHVRVTIDHARGCQHAKDGRKPRSAA